jgi:hypothetical protein
MALKFNEKYQMIKCRRTGRHWSGISPSRSRVRAERPMRGRLADLLGSPAISRLGYSEVL